MRGLHHLHSPLGPIQAAFGQGGALIYLGFTDHEARLALLAKVAALRPMAIAPATLANLSDQLAGYASGRRRAFEIPCLLHGTPFECRVWAALQDIPYSETRTYGQLATALGDARLARAVGRANGANPISILVPCHRLVGATGALTGYAGGLARKEALLRLEGSLRLPAAPGAASR